MTMWRGSAACGAVCVKGGGEPARVWHLARAVNALSARCCERQCTCIDGAADAWSCGTGC